MSDVLKIGAVEQLASGGLAVTLRVDGKGDEAVYILGRTVEALDAERKREEVLSGRLWRLTEEPDLLGRIAQLEARLVAVELARLDWVHGTGGVCPCCGTPFSFCAAHGPYVRTDENVCGACRRGELARK
jgi:hypothetical protein